MSLLTVSASKAGIALLSVASAAIIAKVYGQAGLGIFALMRVAPAVFMVLTDPGFSHAIPFLSGNRKVDERVIIGSSLFVYGGVSAIQIILWIMLAAVIQEYLLSSVPVMAVYFAALLAPMQSVTIVIVNILRSRFQYNLGNSVFMAVEIALLVLAIFSTIWRDPEVSDIVYLLIISSSIALLIGIGFIVFLGSGGMPKLEKTVVFEGLKFGIKSQVGNGFQILNYRLDHLILGAFLTPEKVAVYFVATKSIEFFRFFTSSIVFVFEPIFARQFGSNAQQRVRKMLGPLALANFLLLLIGVLLAPLLYPLVFGGWSSEANDPLVILAVGLAISGSNSLFGAYFLGRGLPSVTTLASLAGLIFTLIFSLILIPNFGIMGAAVTSSLAYTAVTFVYAWVFFRGENHLEVRG